MASENVELEDVETLLTEYLSIYKGYQSLESTNQPSNSKEFQTKLSDLINQTENLIRCVNNHTLFGVNESLEDIPADHLRFILLPALLGYFSSKRTLVDNKGDVGAFRMDSIHRSKIYYEDFLKLCRLYGVKTSAVDEGDGDTETENKKLYQKDAFTRKSEKVLRYKAKKSLDTALQDLFSKMRLDHVDDSTKKEYYSKLIDQWVITAEEELEFIEEELAILEHMRKMKSDGGVVKPPQPKTQPTRPFILTKTDLQKQVFGLGYPSVPTYTVEEFYDAQVRAGLLPPPGSGGSLPPSAEVEAAAAEQQEIVKEFNIENDEPESLQKARDWDDWKDDHRRGWGNTKNKG